MDCKKIKPLLIDFADKNLSEENTKLVRDHLKNCKDCRNEVEELLVLMNELNKTKEEIPSTQLKVNFMNMLEKEKSANQVEPAEAKVIQMRNNSTPGIRQFNPFYQIAAGFAILIAGVMLGLLVNKSNGASDMEIANLQNEVSYMKQVVMLSKLDQQSPSQRIQAVNYVEEIQEADPKVIEALIKTMNTDNNTSVRMAATTALSRFSNDDKVRNAMIESLSIQDDPMIQITLINIMIELHEKKATNNIQKIAHDEQTNKTVKAFAQKGLEILI